MSEFFKNFSKINYNIEKQLPIITTSSVNVMNRVKLRDLVKKNLTSFYPYIIKDYERPDSLSYDYYGNVRFTWIILLANDIIDVHYDWPLFGISLTNYISSKYGSIEQAQTSIHHYEKILRQETQILVDESYKRILEKKVIIDEQSYLETDSGLRNAVTNYDYEIIENEKKRNIILIDKSYVSQIEKEFRNLY